MIAVTAKDVTDRLAHEIGILTVNNVMQILQIERYEDSEAENLATINRLNGLVVDLENQINVLVAQREAAAAHAATAVSKVLVKKRSTGRRK